MKEENKRTENGKNYIDVIETTTYEEVTVKYPFGFEKKKLVKVQDTGDNTEEQPKEKKLTKKQKAGLGLGIILAAALGGRALAAHNKNNEDEDYDEDYVDDQDDDTEEDSDE